jgi:hypothetical protein
MKYSLVWDFGYDQSHYGWLARDASPVSSIIFTSFQPKSIISSSSSYLFSFLCTPVVFLTLFTRDIHAFICIAAGAGWENSCVLCFLKANFFFKKIYIYIYWNNCFLFFKKYINLIYFFRDRHDTNTKETNSLVTFTHAHV